MFLLPQAGAIMILTMAGSKLPWVLISKRVRALFSLKAAVLQWVRYSRMLCSIGTISRGQ